MIAPFWGPTLDCPDPQALAEFYQRVGGGTIAVSSANFVELRSEGYSLGFQCHLDFKTADLDTAEAEAIAAGATKSAVQPHPSVFRVLIDPAGHPFCLSTWGTPAGPPESR